MESAPHRYVNCPAEARHVRLIEHVAVAVSRIAHRDIESPELFDRLSHQPLDGRLIRHVRLDCDGLRAAVADELHHFLGLLDVRAIVDDDLGPFAAKSQSSRSSDSQTGASNYGDAILKIHA